MDAEATTGREALIFAVVVAAGQRDGACAAPPLGNNSDRMRIEAIAGPIRAAGVEEMVVISNPELSMPIALMGHVVVVNYQRDSEMIDSVRIGLDWVGEWATPAPEDGVLVCPVDVPGLEPGDVEAVMAAFRGGPGRIAVAVHKGRRGHPMIFPWAMAADVRGDACDTGLRQLLERHAPVVHEVPLANPAVIRNINTPDDLPE